MAVRPTLHEEMVDILSEVGADGLSFEGLADAVNRRAVYEKRDGSAVQASQVRLRARKYPHLFILDGAVVRLRSLGQR